MKAHLLRIFSLLTIVIFLTSATTLSDSTTVKKPKIFGEGTVLTYFVDNWPDAYLFTVEITKNCKKGFEFHYIFSHNFEQGDITVKPEALKSAMKIYNYFDGTDQVFDDQTSVVMSKKGYELLSKGEEAAFDMGNGDVLTFKKIAENPVDTLEVAINDKYGVENLMGLVAEDENDYTIAVLDNPKFPLIVFMDIGWSITLLNIM